MFNFNLLFESSPGLYLVLAPNLTIYAVTDEYLKATMTKRENIIGRYLFDVFPDNPDDATADGTQNLHASLKYVLKNKQPHAMALQKYDIRKPDGTFEERYWSPYNKPVLNNKGNVAFIIHSVKDVTQRVKNEREIRLKSKELVDYKYAIDAAAIVAITDRNGVITYVNDNFCKITQFNREELIGRDYRIINPLFYEKTFMRQLHKKITQGQTWKGEIKNYAKNGTIFWVNSTIIPFLDENKTPFQYVTIEVDITKEKELQETLRNKAEELKKRQYDLQEAYSELEAQTHKLQASEEELKVHQEELLQSNMELQNKTLLVIEKNKELEIVSEELQKKAEELTLSSKYKSEFLANMSHELRTPLNSILLLSKLLTENTERNLTKEQLDFVSVIHRSGNNLLELINEILDLSKIEAGKMNIDIERVKLDDILNSLTDLFTPVANEKKIHFEVIKKSPLPSHIYTDKTRIEQVLKNFLSNAFKFTEHGSVHFVIKPHNYIEGNAKISFEVKDTGVGIPADKQDMIFDAFQQADGSTRRKYGGTGLGLSISKDIARLLGGEISLKSKLGEGASFVLILPVIAETNNVEQESLPAFTPPASLTFMDNNLYPDLKHIGDHVLELTREKTVTQLSDKKKKLPMGSTILLVDNNVLHAKATADFLGTSATNCLIADTIDDAIQKLNSGEIHCLILDIDFPDNAAFNLLEKIKITKGNESLPTIIYTEKPISLYEEKKLRKYADSIVLKTVDSFQRLATEVSVILSKRFHSSQMPLKLKTQDNALSGKHVLIVDDDIRNIFSLTRILENKDMKVSSAVDGEEALNILDKDKSVQIVLMDMMMPNKDGYETIREIRAKDRIKELPIIAVTAKAMLGDRNKCIDAGANDYITKPVDIEQLMALLRVWIHKK